MGNISDVFSFMGDENFGDKDAMSKDFDDFIDLEEIASLGMDPDDIPESNIDKNQAEYYLKMYKKLATQRDEYKNIRDNKVKAYTENADKWLKQRITPLEHSMEFFSNALQDYASANMKNNRKSIKMFEGTIGFMKQPPEFIREDDKIRSFLKEIDGGDKFLEQLPEKVAWGELKKVGEIEDNIFKLNGQMVNGVTVQMRPDKFSIK